MRKKESTVNSLADLEKTIGRLTKEQLTEHSQVFEASDSSFRYQNNQPYRFRDGFANRRIYISLRETILLRKEKKEEEDGSVGFVSRS
ncbi:hypothetical protein L195_g004063 [Trifolium pratense]|uniref:Uncharacterized protein n=1 Tax=Trifolium pratense TaxID=57577 RepID=A0A2K3NX28_TRIPR|nr:hypothetical protein L195_g002060 [Trifolium pratense]PNY07563.1 hypothetical protein L195_g004063 [Trifolium pratense]